MNLHNIVRNAISTVNPEQDIQVIYYEGYDNSGAIPVIQYSEPVTIKAQIQPVPSEEIQFVNDFNASSIYRNVFITGDLSSINRPMQKGRDKILWDNKEWLVNSLPEGWTATAGWQKLVIVAQIKEN